MGREVAVVLFTDLVSSTELRGRLGEDAADELRRRHDQLLAQAVEANNGQVVKGLGDGIMATFVGAADAVAAAVAIQQGVDRLNRSEKAPEPIAVRVGLSAGDVSVEDADMHGTPVIEASRLCGVASGGRILISDVVRLLAGLADDQLIDQGALDLKGLERAVQASEVCWEPAPAQTIPMPALLTDIGRIFVGRDAELDRLQQLWKEAAAGERRVVLLAGEPGVGKTRLVAELAMRIHDQGGVVLAGRCDEDLGVPYQPFVEALRHFIDHTAAGEFGGALGRYAGELTRLVPELVERIPDSAAAALRSDPETERYRLFEAVGAWVAAASGRSPLLVVLDDLQWAAKPTLLLLRHLVRSPEAQRLLILGTYRDTELTYDHPLVELLADLRRDRGFERVALSGLDNAAVAEIVELASGRVLSDDAAALARLIRQETEGNPFFIREVLRHLVETGAVEGDADGWAPRVPLDQFGIPEGVRDVVGRRLARLSANANRTLCLAAVIGSEFDALVLRAAGHLAEGDVLVALEEAVHARLLTEVAPARYQFSHALVRATLYDSLTGAREAELHRRVAEAIETTYGARLDDLLPALAHHWAKAGSALAENPRAVEYARRAGDRALAQLAPDEAAGYYQQALELLEVSRSGFGGDDCELLIRLGEAQRLAGNPAHRETLLAAADRAHALGDFQLLVRAALANRSGLFSAVGAVDHEKVAVLETALEALGPRQSGHRARVLAALSIELHFTGPERRVRLAREAFAIARRIDDPSTVAETLIALWLATLPTASVERVELAGQLREVTDRLNDPVLEFYVGLARFMIGLELGDLTAADAGLAACTRIAADLGQPVLRWRATYLEIQRAFLDCDLQRAETLAEEALRLGEAAGQADASGFADVYWVRLLQGRIEEAVDLLRPIAQRFAATSGMRALLAWVCAEAGLAEEARAIVTDLRGGSFADLCHDYLWTATVGLLGRASARLGDQDNAAELYELLRPHQAAITVAQSVWVGPVAYDLALLAAALGRVDDSDRHFAEAVAIHDRLGVGGMLPHTLIDWARTLLTRRTPADVERARDLIERAVASAAELGLERISQRALALLEEISP